MICSNFRFRSLLHDRIAAKVAAIREKQKHGKSSGLLINFPPWFTGSNNPETVLSM
jgi:hypothetical protein